MTDLIQMAYTHESKGDIAFGKGHLGTAISQYRGAEKNIEAVRIFVSDSWDAERWLNCSLLPGVPDDISILDFVDTFLLSLRSRAAATCLQLNDHYAVRCWTNAAKTIPSRMVRGGSWDPEEQIGEWERLRRSEHANVRYYKASALEQMGRLDKAIEEIQTVKDFNPDDANVCDRLRDLEKAKEKYEEELLGSIRRLWLCDEDVVL